ncbi:MAG: response regulator [Planctomycetota bacterium]|nr:MAG: response regulator [Planctomycetota bacterium]
MCASQTKTSPRLIDVLLVEDDPGDVLLTRKTLESEKIFTSLHVVGDGVEALEYLRQGEKYGDAKRPDLILLDLNMPRMDGRELLAVLKADEDLKNIPVVVLTTSSADEDILRSYDLQASCYVTKPVDLDAFKKVIAAIGDFWLACVRYPPHDSG